ncbi:hypothetical protein TH61_08395 [Rufibacter sp. DG15C]|nr:hypothetical protein TH61_08395 [Rufibacter sp. DG15C]
MNKGYTTRPNTKTMKTLKAYLFSLLLVMSLTLSSCEVIGDIFEAGMWTAVIIIVLIVLLIGWLFRKLRR